MGIACATVGNPPLIGFNGSFSTSPNPNFGITIEGAYPSSTGLLLLALDANCPAVLWGTCELYTIPFFHSFSRMIDGSGKASVGLPIPTLPVGGGIGVTVIAQWVVVPPIAGKQTSEGLSFTLSTL